MYYLNRTPEKNKPLNCADKQGFKCKELDAITWISLYLQCIGSLTDDSIAFAILRHSEKSDIDLLHSSHSARSSSTLSNHRKLLRASPIQQKDSLIYIQQRDNPIQQRAISKYSAKRRPQIFSKKMAQSSKDSPIQ